MRIATAPVNWNNPDVPEYRAWLPYERMMDEFVEAGYDATEWGPGMPEDPAELKAALDARGLDMVGAFVGLGFRDADRHDAEMAKAMEIARRLHATGGRLLIAAEAGDDRRRGEAGHVDEANGLTDEQWRNLARGLHDLADNLAPLGMRVVFHNHVGHLRRDASRDRPAPRRDGPREGGLVPGHRAPRLRRRRQPRDARQPTATASRTSTSRTWTATVLARGEGRRAGASAQALKAYIFPPLGEGIAQVPEVRRGAAGPRLRRLVRPGAGHQPRATPRTSPASTGSTSRACWPASRRPDGDGGGGPRRAPGAGPHADLEALARRGRLHVIETVAHSGAGHVGGPLSAMDLLVALYFRVLRIRPDEPAGPSATGSSCPRATAPWRCTR